MPSAAVVIGALRVKLFYNFFPALKTVKYLIYHFRTESVVEKLLTNWLSLCMYKYLRVSIV